MQLYALIMAGGSGTRLWPRSRPEHPKQFLDITGDLTMLQEAQTRLVPLVPPERVYVATNQGYVDIVKRQLPAVPAANILGEPAGRGTAAAIGLAAIHLRHNDPGAVMAVLTADHLINDTQTFRSALAAAKEVAEDGWLVTLGIRPTYPETGYGYIQRGEPLRSVDGIDAYRVVRFAEKPEGATAEQFLSTGEYAWNSGMFIWQVERILSEMEQHMPELYAGLIEIERGLETPEAERILARVWPNLPNETIDYGIMEKADRVAVLPVEIGWNDVGSWAAVYDVLPHDEHGNAVVGRHLTTGTRGSLVYAPKRLVATFGLEDIIVVDTEDVILIGPRSQSQDVKQLVAMFQAQEKAEALPTLPAASLQPLPLESVGKLFALATPAEAALLSLVFHAGLSPEMIARLTREQIDLPRSMLAIPGCTMPLPDRTVQLLTASMNEWERTADKLFPHWNDPAVVEAVIEAIGRRAGLTLNAAIAHQTLAQALFQSSEEGQTISSVLGSEAALAHIPLESHFPFSIGNFEGGEDGELARRARQTLDRAAGLL